MPNNMRLERVTRFLTINEVADQIGVHPNAIGRWERGEAEPTSSNLIALAHLYGCTPDWLLGLTNDRSSTAIAASN